MNDPRTSRLTRRRLVETAAAGAAAAGILGQLSAPAVFAAQDSTEIRLVFGTVNETWDAKLQTVVDAFMALNPAVKVKVEARPGEELWTKLQTEYASGSTADVCLIQMDWTVPGASRGMFVDLKPLLERDAVDQSDLWYDMEREWGYEGGMYGTLLYTGGQYLYVNKGLLAAAGVAMPTADWTWDDLLTAAKACTDEANQQYGVYFAPIAPPYWSSSFVHGAGGTVLNDAKDECTINSTEAREALQWLVDLIHVHKVMPSPAATEGQDNPFLTGKVAFFFGGSWEEAGIRETDIDWDFLHMPAHPTTGKKSTQLGSNAWSIFSTSDKQDAAWELIKYMGGAEGAKAMMTLGVPGYTSVIESPEYKELHAPQDITIPIADFMEFGHDYYPTSDAGEWWTAIDSELEPMWTGEDTVENSTQRAADRVNEIFSQRGSY